MSGHDEFPELSPEARAALEAAYKAAFPWDDGYKEEWKESNRRGQATFLREAMKQTGDWDELEAIANNLHNPPPNLAQAREADLDMPKFKAAVRAFLARLGEGVQP